MEVYGGIEYGGMLWYRVWYGGIEAQSMEVWYGAMV